MFFFAYGIFIFVLFKFHVYYPFKLLHTLGVDLLCN